MIRSKFFEDPNGGYAKVAVKRNFDGIWKKLITFETKKGVTLDDGFTKEQYIDLFNSMKIRHTSAFPNYKSGILAYVRYLIANGVLSNEQEDILVSVTVDDLAIKESSGVLYYKNLNMLKEAIQDSIKVSECYDDTLFDLPAAILYLAWYGLSEDEIINYPKTDVLDDGVMVRGEKIEPPYDILQVFKRLRDSDGYYQQARGVIFHKYTYSEYLIRTERNSKASLTVFWGLINRLNALMDKAYSLSYNVVYHSGIFYRAYLLECESSKFDLDDPEFASKVFCEDLSNKVRRTSRIRDYKLYKQLFY